MAGRRYVGRSARRNRGHQDLHRLWTGICPGRPGLHAAEGQGQSSEGRDQTQFASCHPPVLVRSRWFSQSTTAISSASARRPWRGHPRWCRSLFLTSASNSGRAQGHRVDPELGRRAEPSRSRACRALSGFRGAARSTMSRGVLGGRETRRPRSCIVRKSTKPASSVGGHLGPTRPANARRGAHRETTSTLPLRICGSAVPSGQKIENRTAARDDVGQAASGPPLKGIVDHLGLPALAMKLLCAEMRCAVPTPADAKL